MPYATNAELPPAVRNHLPQAAQDIFREAFNDAHTRYGNDDAVAFRVAWGAVKREYEKIGRRWVPKWLD